MKNLAAFFLLTVLAGTLSGCLYSPDITYTYWRYSETSKMYSAIRTEKPLTADEMQEQGLVEKLPENAKTFEAR